MALISAGLLMYRITKSELELFLAHPGGPFWKNKDDGAWTIPKGLVEADEDPLTAAIREFREETSIEPQGPFLELGTIKQKSGKQIHAWAFAGDADPQSIRSNTMKIEFPPRSKKWITVPEVDRCGWFTPAVARRKANPAQVELIDRLVRLLDPMTTQP